MECLRSAGEYNIWYAAASPVSDSQNGPLIITPQAALKRKNLVLLVEGTVAGFNSPLGEFCRKKTLESKHDPVSPIRAGVNS